ncbi:MAG: hypothetical protein DVS81_02730 [Candidatus Accumulibacter meliphilus]|jgi:hypothetical protein|uniref:DUF3237 domain-containing protein n=1 Tax=Candidatus Accumulibacter meliphilus TaxID=2211374 RepID=A0A369XPW1_9PROT|nr:MAG: hypothetical protein DVS81_02730 [Candidatus Accumulibacter meliphilus]
MSIHEEQSLSGRLTIELRTPDGRIVCQRQHDNLITTAGKALVARIFSGEVTGKPELRIAVGSSASDARPEDTLLGEPRDEVVATTKQVTVVSEDGQQRALATVMATFPPIGDGRQELHEAGIVIRFPNLDPVLYNRVTFGSITRTGNLDMTLSWEVLF